MIIVDLDGTLCDDSNRKYLVSGSDRDYDMYHKMCTEDVPRKEILQFLQVWMSIHPEEEIVFLTGRPSTYIEETHLWINKYVQPQWKWTLIMRLEGETNPSTAEWKVSMLDRFFEKKEITLILDDSKRNVLEFLKYGYPAILV